jgi:hypothetical protein
MSIRNGNFALYQYNISPIRNSLQKYFFPLSVLCLCIFLFAGCGYKKLVENEEVVSKAWSDMENDCQERMDKTGQIIETFGAVWGIKPQMFSALKTARDTALDVSAKAGPSRLSQDDVTMYEDAQIKLKTVLDSFFRIADKTPAMAEDPEYRTLKKDIKDLDDKINASMLLYNEAALKYNSSRQAAWKMVMVQVARFKPKGYFLKLQVNK